MAKSYLFLADGFEEIEALATLDIMRRAQMDVATVSITDNKTVKGSHSVPVQADLLLSDITPDQAVQAEWLILPGGLPGATNLAACGKLTDMLRNQFIQGRRIAAICASPAVVLAPLGLLRGMEATCYPTCKDDLEKGGAVYVDQRAVLSDNVLTGSGPGSTFEFGLAIVSTSLGNDVAASVAAGMLI